MSETVFYLVTIIFVLASPLIVPVGVTVAHAVSESWKRLAAFLPARRGAAPAMA